MTRPAPGSDPDDVIARFMAEYGAAADRPAVVAAFCAAHPSYADDFRAFAAADERLHTIAPEPAESAPRLAPGEMLGDFRVVRFLAHGGMGEIYEAEQLCLSRRRVALKVISRGKVSPDARARFLREQEVLAKLHQTNIVPVFAAGERDELQFFAMQYIDGATLGHVVKFLRAQGRNGGTHQTPSLARLVGSVVESHPPAVSAAAPTVSQSVASADSAAPTAPPELTDEYCRSVAASLADIADSLDAVHRARVLHRDVKPSNLMAERSGKCWVIDFGLAGLVDPPPSPGPEAEPESALTATGAQMGTFAYMAPEQFDGAAEPQSDVWGLGVTLYELLALRRPFDGPSRADYQRQAREVEPPRLRTVARNVPRDLDAICRKAMRKNPADRYASAGDFANDLRCWLRSEPTVANPPWSGRRVAMWAKRNPGWAAMVSVAWLAVIAVAGLLIQSERHRTRAAEAEADANQEKAARADDKASAAEREVGLRDRQIGMAAFVKERLSPRTAGWRDRLWKKGEELSKGGKEPDLRDGMAALLSGLDAKPTREFDTGSATALAFDRTGQRLLIGGYGTDLTRVRDLSGAVKVSTQESVAGIGWRGDVPLQLVLTSDRANLLLWDVDRNVPVEEFEFPERFRPVPYLPIAARVMASLLRQRFSVPVSLPRSELIAVLSADATHVAALVKDVNGERAILVWRTGAPAPVTIPIEKSASPFPDTLALSPDGTLLALGTGDGRVRVWNLVGGPKPLTPFDLGRTRITALAFARHRHLIEQDRLHPNGVAGWHFAVGDSGGRVVVWELGRLDRVMDTRESHHEVFAFAFSPDAETLFSTGRVQVRCWDVSSGRQHLVLNSGYNWVTAFAATPAGDRLAVGTRQLIDESRGVNLLDLEAGQGIQALRGLSGQVSRVTITPDGKRAAAITQGFQAGVWDVATGEMLMKADIPTALYADHADIRLTDDGRFLVVASGEEARRWELPVLGKTPARQTDVWPLSPAFSNRIGITPERKVLIGRNETRSGKSYPTNQVDPRNDPRCVRIYELPFGGKPREIVRHDEHAWHVFQIHASPDGSRFISDGRQSPDPKACSIVAYAATVQIPLWRIDFPDDKTSGSSMSESSGTVLRYAKGSSTYVRRLNPYRGEPDTPVNSADRPGLGWEIAFRATGSSEIGLRLTVPDSPGPFLTLCLDERVPVNEWRFTPNGSQLIFGLEDGTVLVGDMGRIRELLNSVNMGW